MRRSLSAILATFLLLVLCPETILADSAEVLPKGVFSLFSEAKFYLPVEKRFGPDGKTEDAAVDFNTNLNSSVFPDLKQLEAFFGMPTGSASIGQSVVSFKYDFTIVDTYLLYGITDRLTVGVKIPYWWVKNTVNANLDTTRSTVGKNAALATLTPLAVPGTVPLITEDVQALLGKGLDVNGDGTVDIPGLGYKRFGTYKNNGLADIEAGAKYQYLSTDKWRLAFTGGLRFPTGKVDDPDNLVDYPLGSGAYAFLFRSHNDYIGIKNLVLDLTLKYDLVLSHNETMRIISDPNQPIADVKEDLSINPGDVFELEASGSYNFGKGFTLTALYKYGKSWKDSVKGSGGHIDGLEEETNYTEQVFEAYLGYTTMPLFLEKKFPLPLNAFIGYRNRFAGSNNVLKSQYISFGLQFFFAPRPPTTLPAPPTQ